jgi:hypothetical protein
MKKRQLMTNASSRRQVKRAERKAKETYELEREDVSLLMKEKRFRRTLWRYLERCGIFQSSFDPDPYNTAFREGERSIGLMLLGEVMEASPEGYAKMTKEVRGENVDE